VTLPVPTQDTFTVGEKLTAALMNKDVRDSVNYLVNRPIALVYQNVAQSIPNGTTFTAVTFDSSIIDTYNGHSNSTNNSRYTAQVAGWYDVLAQIGCPSNATGIRAALIQVNGATPTANPEVEFSPTSGGGTLFQIGAFVFLNVGDYVQVELEQTSGAAMSLLTALTWMRVRWEHA
jgi:hypothetical protein